MRVVKKETLKLISDWVSRSNDHAMVSWNKHYIWGYMQKFPDWVDNEINNNKHSLRSNTKGYGGKTH
jgi:hypothetical protein